MSNYKMCPKLKVVTTDDHHAWGTGTETKGDTHGVCSEDGMDCSGHCEMWPKPPVRSKTPRPEAPSPVFHTPPVTDEQRRRRAETSLFRLQAPKRQRELRREETRAWHPYGAGKGLRGPL